MLFQKNKSKKEIAKNLIRNSHIISIQVINEMSNILLKKELLTPFQVEEAINIISMYKKIVPITVETIKFALKIKSRYKYSYYDSVIIASALENNCNFLYTEDMQDGQLIENRLKVVNPFKSIQQ